MDDDENAARDNDLRVANNVLKFWFACPIRRCRRARSCVGDSRLSRDLLPVVRRRSKVWWRTLLGVRTAPPRRPAAPPVKPWRRRKRAALMQGCSRNDWAPGLCCTAQMTH